LAENPLISEPIAGPVRVLKTFAVPPPPPPDSCPNAAFRSGPAAHLPDCRAYEMVSPVDKNGADIAAPDQIGDGLAGLLQAAASVPDGAPGLTYSSYRAFGDAVSATFSSQYIAFRTPDGDGEWNPGEGWSSHGVSPPREFDILLNESLDTEFRAFSADLCDAWLLHAGGPILDPEALGGFANLYRRPNCGPGADSYEPIFPLAEPANLKPADFAPALGGVSSDGSRAAFRVNDALAVNAGPPANPGANHQCYGSTEGELRLLGVLPSGKATKDHCAVGTTNPSGVDTFRPERLQGAVSSDASRVFFTTSGDERGPGELYVRLNGFEAGKECAFPTAPCTLALGAGFAPQQRFWHASPEGSAAIFSVGPLNGGHDLYRYDVEAEERTQIAGEAAGIMGASADASRVYLVSAEDRDGEEGPAAEGEPNLYLWEAGEGEEAPTFTFVATLSGRDAESGTSSNHTGVDRRVTGAPSPVNFHPLKVTARVSPDGDAVAFMSNSPELAQQVAGRDITDATSPLPCGEERVTEEGTEHGLCDAQVYLYDAAAEELRCVSCNPTGARPTGRAFSSSLEAPPFWAAAQLTPIDSPFHQNRALSADGERLFFESFEGLVLRDTNGARDIYQWQAPGKGSCATSHPDFSEPAGGCISLISTGKSPKSSEFLDAPESGADAFFTTAASLASADPGLLDVYDARVGGGFPEPVRREGCQGEACQSPPPSPVSPTPSSLGFQGPGDLPSAGRPCAGPAAKARRASRRARSLRAAARRAKAPARSRGRPAARGAQRARQRSRVAKRCRRAHARGQGRDAR
ncbi:MAG: hypothetical protein WD649_04830, partial [Thermoleophilaceae bacterium]